MAYSGLIVFDSAELANAERFEAYAGDASWFHPLYRKDGISYMLGQTYTDPATDGAVWYDPDVPESADLYGFYPVTITGVEGSSRQANVVQSTREGGTPGRIRHATKEVNVSGFVAGASEKAVVYGLAWLRRATLGALCSPLDTRKQALGTTLELLGTEPASAADIAADGDSAALALFKTTQQYRRVVVSNFPDPGPVRPLSCGDYISQVQFTLTLGDPFSYTEANALFTSMFDDGGTVWGSQQVTPGTEDDSTATEATCGVATWAPLYDPECTVVITPPTPPNVALGCWEPPIEGTSYPRHIVTVPEQNFPAYTDLLPIITLTNSGDPIRNIRLRFWPDPDGTLDVVATPCAWISDIIVSYIPAGYMVIDASHEDVHFTTTGGHTRRADSLIFATDQRPVVWPVLDCGVQYLITVDTLTADDDRNPVMDVALVGRRV